MARPLATHKMCALPSLPPLLLSSPLAPIGLLYTIPRLLSSQALRLIVAATDIDSLYEHLQPLLDGLPCGCVVVFGGGGGI